MKIVFMGTPDFATKTLKAVKEAGHEVAVVVTQPDKPVKRSSQPIFSPVKKMALELSIPVMQPEKATDESFVNEIRAIAPEAIVVVAYGQILSKDFLDIPKLGCINVHASLLPKYRGASPIQWAVINGDEYSGVTTMLMGEGVDTGDILLEEKVLLDKKETGGSLFEKLSSVGAQLLIKTLDGIQNNTITPVRQDESKALHVRMLKKSMGELDFSRSAAELERLIRGLDPWPSAFTYINGKKLTVWGADAIDKKEDVKLTQEERGLISMGSAEFGLVTKVEKNSFNILCCSSILKVTEVQLEGKKRMPVSAFLNGNHLLAGEKL